MLGGRARSGPGRWAPDWLARRSLFEDPVGLAVAVLLDATIVRALLLPATMKLGDWNWYLTSWLDQPPGLRARGLLYTEPGGAGGIKGEVSTGSSSGR